MHRIIKTITRLEKKIYPRAYRQMQWVKSFKDLAEYCEAKPYVLTWESGYLIYTSDEIVDLASLKPMSISQLLDIVNKLRSFYGNRIISADFRRKTSYKLIKFAEMKKIVKIHSDYQYEWSGELFHEIEFSFISR